MCPFLFLKIAVNTPKIIGFIIYKKTLKRAICFFEHVVNKPLFASNKLVLIENLYSFRQNIFVCGSQSQ